MALLIALVCIAAAAAILILLPKKLRFSVRLRMSGVYSEFSLCPIPLWISANVVYRYPKGVEISVMGKKLRPKKRGKTTPPSLSAIELRTVSVWGRVGLQFGPEASVAAAGLLTTAIMQALCLLKTERPNVSIEPRFSEKVFAVNADGIAVVHPVKLILGYVKKKRRKNNGSSNRKHNALVDGADKAAR